MEALTSKEMRQRARMAETGVSIYCAAMMVSVGFLNHPLIEIIALSTLLILGMMTLREYWKYSRAYRKAIEHDTVAPDR